jgi:hypothetical protein
MTPDRDTTRIVRSWLETGATDLPDRVLDKVLDQLPATPQRRRVRQARRFTQMNSSLKLGVAAAAVVVAGVVGINLLPGNARTGVGAPASPSPSPSASPDSSAVGSGPLSAGRYHILVRLHNYLGSTYTVQPGATPLAEPIPGGVARVSFDLPAGWSGFEGWAVGKGIDTASELAMLPVTLERVFIEPCRWSQGNLADPPLVKTLDGLAEALTVWWGVGSSAGPTLAPGTTFAPTLPTATKPTNVTLAGLGGRYVEVRTPADVDIATCDLGKYVLFAKGDGQRWVQGAGELDQLWLVDVDGVDEELRGGLLVIDAASQPGVSPEDLAELQAIVDSIEIELLGGS